MPWKKKVLTPARESTIIRDGKTYPLFYCKLIRYQWVFVCKYCNAYHRHGALPGHVQAHCTNRDSPLIKTGYFIELETDNNAQM